MRVIISILALILGVASFGRGVSDSAVVQILTSATGTGAGDSYRPWGAKRTFHVSASTSSGTGWASVSIEASNDNTNWSEACAIALSISSTVVDDGCVMDAPWKYVRANVTDLAGAGTEDVDVIMGTE